MKLQQKNIFCDWITVSQTHEDQHQPLRAGVKTVTDINGDITQITQLPVNHQGAHGSTLQISSDGYTVKVSGNPSRWNRSENVHGLDLDQVKNLINQILQSLKCPLFAQGDIHQLSDGTQKYTGAIFSRIDMTANIKTGSPQNRDKYLQYQQTQEYPKLVKQLFLKNIYYGKGSDSRTIRIYDKALHLKQQVLPNTDEPQYINQLINWTNQNGIIRFETEYRRYLRNNNLRYWHKSTQENLSIKTMLDIHKMTPQIEIPDYGDMPKEVLSTLAMYIIGVKVKKLLSKNAYYKHRKILKTYGYDISNDNVYLLQPKVKIITLEPVEMPDFYKHATGKI